MLKFYGEVSSECKKFLLKKQVTASIWAMLVVLFLCSIPIIILAVKVDLIFLCFYAPIVVMIISVLVPPRGKTLEKIFPNCLVITGDIIICKGKDFDTYRNNENIKSIYDFGEFYYFTFKFPHKDGRFLCQKSLLVEGELEEFEKKFWNKIKNKG